MFLLILHYATGYHLFDVGELYTWGRDEGDGRLGLGPNRGPNEGGGLSIPSKVKALPMPVAAVSCGGFFTMVLTENGELWNWGGKMPLFVYFCLLPCPLIQINSFYFLGNLVKENIEKSDLMPLINMESIIIYRNFITECLCLVT
jgi:alpha-tubulin suppressor-like RCC1 family protein